MARRPVPSIKRPTLEYFRYRGPHRVATGDLAPTGLPGVVFAPTSGRRLPVVAFAHGWLQPVDRYADTLRYLASWGVIVVAPDTQRGPIPSYQGLAFDLSTALRRVATGQLADGRVRGDLRRLAVMGHSTGGGAAILAAAKDDAIKAVITVTAAETRPSAVQAAGLVEVPSLHLIGKSDNIAEADGSRIARSCTGPSILRVVKGSGHLGLTEGKHWTNTFMGVDSNQKVQQITRMLASAFLLRHLTDNPQLADEMEESVRGTELLDTTEPEPAPEPVGVVKDAFADAVE